LGESERLPTTAKAPTCFVLLECLVFADSLHPVDPRPDQTHDLNALLILIINAVAVVVVVAAAAAVVVVAVAATAVENVAVVAVDAVAVGATSVLVVGKHIEAVFVGFAGTFAFERLLVLVFEKPVAVARVALGREFEEQVAVRRVQGQSDVGPVLEELEGLSC
jgi:hypothetical protein